MIRSKNNFSSESILLEGSPIIRDHCETIQTFQSLPINIRLRAIFQSFERILVSICITLRSMFMKIFKSQGNRLLKFWIVLQCAFIKLSQLSPLPLLVPFSEPSLLWSRNILLMIQMFTSVLVASRQVWQIETSNCSRKWFRASGKLR